jgi:hypothetical protein
MSAHAVLERAQRRLRVIRTHIGFRFFLGWVIFAVVFVTAISQAPRQLVDEHRILLALVLALTSVVALFMLAYAFVAMVTKERQGSTDAT